MWNKFYAIRFQLWDSSHITLACIHLLAQDSRTPLELAEEDGHSDIVQLLCNRARVHADSDVSAYVITIQVPLI